MTLANPLILKILRRTLWKFVDREIIRSQSFQIPRLVFDSILSVSEVLEDS